MGTRFAGVPDHRPVLRWARPHHAALTPLLAVRATDAVRIPGARGRRTFPAPACNQSNTDVETHGGLLECVASFRDARLCRLARPARTTVSIFSNPE